MKTFVLTHPKSSMEKDDIRSTQTILDAHLVKLNAQLAAIKQQNDSTRWKTLLDNYQHHRLQLKARYKIEEERIGNRFDSETRCTQAHFATKKSELKEHLLDRLRRKRKLVVDEMRSAIDIHSRSFDADPLLITMQPPHPLQAKAYNFRQRTDVGQTTSTFNDDESILNSIGNLSPIPSVQLTRKRLVGAFSLFQMPRWTVKDEECEDDLRLICQTRR